MSAIAPELIAIDVDSHEMIPLQMWEESFNRFFHENGKFLLPG